MSIFPIFFGLKIYFLQINILFAVCFTYVSLDVIFFCHFSVNGCNPFRCSLVPSSLSKTTMRFCYLGSWLAFFLLLISVPLLSFIPWQNLCALAGIWSVFKKIFLLPISFTLKCYFFSDWISTVSFYLAYLYLSGKMKIFQILDIIWQMNMDPIHILWGAGMG